MPSKVPTYRPANAPTTADRHRDYDRMKRDRDARSFYHSRRWAKIRRVKLSLSPYCERCIADQRLVPATLVHHRVERRDDPSLALDIDNLESLCAACHSRHHKMKSDESAGDGR